MHYSLVLSSLCSVTKLTHGTLRSACGPRHWSQGGTSTYRGGSGPTLRSSWSRSPPRGTASTPWTSRTGSLATSTGGSACRDYIRGTLTSQTRLGPVPGGTPGQCLSQNSTPWRSHCECDPRGTAGHAWGWPGTSGSCKPATTSGPWWSRQRSGPTHPAGPAPTPSANALSVCSRPLLRGKGGYMS